MSLTDNNLPLQLSTSSSDTHSSLVPAKKNKKSFYHSVEWESEKKIEATNCHSCRPLQNKMKKKTYPEKHRREKWKWQICSRSKDIQYNLKAIRKFVIRWGNGKHVNLLLYKITHKQALILGFLGAGSPGELARWLQRYMKINKEW